MKQIKNECTQNSIDSEVKILRQIKSHYAVLKKMNKWVVLGSASLLIGCSNQLGSTATAKSTLMPTLYDYSITSGQNTALSLLALGQAVKDADIILVGEWHGHPGVHLMQAQLLAQLYSQNINLVLSMEQFSRDHQKILNQYLTGEIGEKALIKNTNAWSNYSSDYRPLVEFAKQNSLDVIAANAPKTIVRCIGKNGAEYLTRLPLNERKWVAQQLTLTADGYQEKFNSLMHHGDEVKTKQQFAAQTTWDDTMAESMVNYLAKHPGRQIMHVAGRFHVAEGLGIASRIKSRNANLNVVMITPVTETSSISPEAIDYRLSVMPLPKSYVNKDEMKLAMKGLHSRNKDLKCY
ncbi:ChaN family lipoprotein [Psychromonas sp. Urea-02u-13]|uniref:ChaN family lipoprotein n=1 Tax=Psychromonas sp. Urea-02u-13 TaxID=2058326 RepID=UPI0018E2DDA5|nr:ChaN family lipoprotein [Psychromonas sp. Urea-02u-13]